MITFKQFLLEVDMMDAHRKASNIGAKLFYREMRKAIAKTPGVSDVQVIKSSTDPEDYTGPESMSSLGDYEIAGRYKDNFVFSIVLHPNRHQLWGAMYYGDKIEPYKDIIKRKEGTSKKIGGKIVGEARLYYAFSNHESNWFPNEEDAETGTEHIEQFLEYELEVGAKKLDIGVDDFFKKKKQ